MKPMSIGLKKLCAVILSVMVIFSAVPMAMAVGDSPETTPANAGVSTPDEVPETQEPTNPTPEPSSDIVFDESFDPNFMFNADATHCLSNSNEIYFTGSKLKKIVICDQPDSEKLEKIKEEFSSDNKTNAEIWLKNGEDETNLSGDCTFSVEGDTFSAALDLTKTYKDGLASGEYMLVLKYKFDGTATYTELCFKTFHILNENPDITGLKYNGQDSLAWSKSDVEVSFSVGSPIIASVMYKSPDNDTETVLTGKDSIYSFTAKKLGEYTIKATDRLGHEATAETMSVLIDNQKPLISAPKFFDKDKNEVTHGKWTNNPVTVEFTVTDDASGIDPGTVTVSGISDVTVEDGEDAKSVVVSFKVEENKDYTLSCKDNAGNEADYTVEKGGIPLDTKAPEAKDFTLTFSAAENNGDKILSFLTFGLYSNDDILVTVDVDNAGQSDIPADSIKLFDEEQELESVNGKQNEFVLKAPENDGDKVEFDLFVQATDSAGNESEKIRFKDNAVKTKLPDGTDVLKYLEESLYEIIISKVAPDFGKNGAELAFENKAEIESKTFVKGDGTVSVKVLESVSGIKKVTATLDGSNVEVTVAPDPNNETEKKVTELTASAGVNKLEDGEHELVFTAVANSGMSEEYTVLLTADNSAPKLEEKLSHVTDDGSWTNTDVNISFSLSDSVPIKSVQYYNSTQYPDPTADGAVVKTLDGDMGAYSFTADAYGEYTVLAEDVLGNKTSYKTEKTVQIDKEKPEVLEGQFSYSDTFSNSPVTVTFTVKDNPENCSGIAAVTVDDGKIAASKVDGPENVYSFIADHYGKYSVKITDNAGNESDNYEVGPINIDLIPPKVESIAFSAANKVMDYGIYTNADLKVTVTVENVLNDDGKGSELKSIILKDGDKDLGGEFTQVENSNFYTLTTTISPGTSPVNLSVYAKDGAGNEVENKITDDSVQVLVDKSAIEHSSLSEVVVTLQKPEFVKRVTQEFDKQKKIESGKYSGNTIYSGKGSFSAEISDSLSGIDSYEIYFVEKKTDLEKPLESVSDISKDSKQTSVEIKFDADVAGKAGSYTAIVSAKNLSGNVIRDYKTILVDNKPPEITEVKLKTNGDEKDTITKNGIYTSEPIDIEVVWDDGKYTAGIQNIELFNGDASIGTSEDGKFNLSKSGQYILSGLATDAFGNKKDANEDFKSKTLIVNDSKLNIDPDNFEIVICDEDEIEKKGNEYSFCYKNDETRVYKENDNGDDGKISAEITNTLGGLKKTSVDIKDANGDSLQRDTVLEEMKDDFGKVTACKLSIDAKGFSSGKYEVNFSATDLGGNKRNFNETFYIDKSAPEVESITYEKATSVADQVLNLLTFGLYSNNDIKAVVTVTDEAPSCGIDENGITLTSRTGKEIAKGAFIEKDGVYTKEYTLKATEVADSDGSFYSDLMVSATDKFDNCNGEKSFRDVPDSIGKDNDDFEIVATQKAPKVVVTAVEGKNKYTNPDNKTLWFSAQPTVSFNVTDNISKIHSISVALNGEDVTKFTTFPAEVNQLSAGVFTDFTNHSGESYSEISASINTANENIKDLVTEGENKVTIIATGNNGVSRSEEKIFYYDTTPPVVTQFDFEKAEGDKEGINTPPVEVTKYGFFFKERTVVTITATDNGGSGVQTIFYRLDDVDKDNGVDGDPIESEAKADGDGRIQFTVAQNFRGNITARAKDNVENLNQTWVNPDDSVVETKDQHDNNTDVTFTLPQTGFADNANQKLYGGPIDINFTAKSSYAGIRTIQYQVSSKYDTNNDYQGSIEVANNGTVTTEDSHVKQITPTFFTEKSGKQTNLVTHINATLSINNNSNDIVVKIKVIDRANWGDDREFTSETFSIDSTAPRIQVTWDPETGNVVNNIEYYKQSRTATVTVTERNFDPDDFKWPVTNTYGPKPTLVPGENWNKTYAFAADPDATIHKATIVFNDDGDEYVLETSYRDLAGHDSPDNGKKEKTFTVDKTQPTISISYQVGDSSSTVSSLNEYNNKKVQVIITIHEHNFIDTVAYLEVTQTATAADNVTPVSAPSVSNWTSSGGDDHVATIDYLADKQHDGKFSVDVTFKDKALNVATPQATNPHYFYIDTQINELNILNVEDDTAYDGSVAPLIQYFDHNYAEGTYSMKRIDLGRDADEVKNLIPTDEPEGKYNKVVTYSNFPRVEENDGIYVLDAQIKDKAGNVGEKSLTFSVNRFGPTFRVLDEKTKELLETLRYTNDAPNIIINEINVKALTNPSVKLTRDDDNRTLEIGRDKDYEIYQNSGSKQNWYAYDYKLFARNFEAEGTYMIMISATDEFKNNISNRSAYNGNDQNDKPIDRTYPVSFTVDKTAPIVTVTGIASSEYYEEASKNVIINCDDANITSQLLKIEFDGEELKKDTDYMITSETSGNVEVKLELEADGKNFDRNFKVTISDKANNFNNLSEGGEVKAFRLSATFIARLLHYNLPLVIVIGCVVLAGIAFLIFMFIRKRKKK